MSGGKIVPFFRERILDGSDWAEALHNQGKVAFSGWGVRLPEIPGMEPDMWAERSALLREPDG
ncbi:hypothetical protein SACS_0116 [Parasaccharibacter apium]|uniref:Uncharacterized protein n=1 Tax=Parasaccharibacter apium TaxID=1510841 RepID=A0A7U7J001_9PROT|nr:hypothetical protein SACS_0116 [Parasaccharibacter apium]